MSARHLVLVGMMGSGKSTVGKRCAERLGRPFVDTDELIEVESGAPVTEVFARDGEAVFRELERRAVADACAAPIPTVIAAGGGAVLEADNRTRLRAAGIVVWLQASPAKLAVRVGEANTRPLLQHDPEGTLLRLDMLRRPAYEAAAHEVVDTSGLPITAVVDAVLEKYSAGSERVSGQPEHPVQPITRAAKTRP